MAERLLACAGRSCASSSAAAGEVGGCGSVLGIKEGEVLGDLFDVWFTGERRKEILI